MSEDQARIARLRAPGLRLSAQAKCAILLGTEMHFASCRQNGVSGTTMKALERRGLAVVRIEREPYRHMVYRLTHEGVALRSRWESMEHDRMARSGFIGKSLAESAATLAVLS